MNVLNPELMDLLAQRYVLGTMRGAARRRMAAWITQRDDARVAVRYWEQRLAPLAWRLEGIQPSDLVWPRICRQLGIESPAPAASTRWAPGAWAAVAAAFGIVALVTAGGWWNAARRPPEIVTETIIERVPAEVAVAVVSNEAGLALWIARIVPDTAELTVRVVNDVEQRPDNDYELWALTDAGVPVSLGLLPQSGERTVALNPAALSALAASSTLAVSLEPSGGSPGALPTGPVLYTAALLAP